MDPLSAALNALAAILTFAGKIIDRAPADTVGDIITRHQARADRLWAFVEKLLPHHDNPPEQK